MTAQATLDVGPPVITFHDKPYRHYQVNGLRVPSVTQVIGLLDKPALKWWAQRTAVEAVCTLAIQYGADDQIFRDPARLQRVLDDADIAPSAHALVRLYSQQNCTLPFDRPDDVLRLVKQSEESIQAVMKKAAERGTILHADLENYAQDGTPPNPDADDGEFRGYRQALCKWLAKYRPTFHGTEVVVGSARHHFGGRLDNFLTLRGQKDELPWLIDLKTNKKGEIYPREHFTQVEGYRLAAEECGHGPFAGCAVLAVGPDGTFTFRKSTGRPETFLALLAAFREIKRDEDAEKAAR